MDLKKLKTLKDIFERQKNMHAAHILRDQNILKQAHSKKTFLDNSVYEMKNTAGNLSEAASYMRFTALQSNLIQNDIDHIQENISMHKKNLQEDLEQSEKMSLLEKKLKEKEAILKQKKQEEMEELFLQRMIYGNIL